MVRSSALRLAGMVKTMYDDRLKTEEKCNKELARRKDEYERHLKEVPALLLLTVALWLSLWLEHRALALLVLSALVLTVQAVAVALALCSRAQCVWFCAVRRLTMFQLLSCTVACFHRCTKGSGDCQIDEFAQEKKEIRKQHHEDRAIRLITKKIRLHRHKLLEIAEAEAKGASLAWLLN